MQFDCFKMQKLLVVFFLIYILEVYSQEFTDNNGNMQRGEVITRRAVERRFGLMSYESNINAFVEIKFFQDLLDFFKK